MLIDQIRVCTECGAEFIPRYGPQKTCCRDCSKHREDRRKQERDKRRYRGKKQEKQEKKTDWKAITRICVENHLTYGQAVEKGLI